MQRSGYEQPKKLLLHQTGRYQIIEKDGKKYKLDTMTGDLTKIDFEELDKETTKKSTEGVIQSSFSRNFLKMTVFREGREIPKYFELWELSYNIGPNVSDKDLSILIRVTSYYMIDNKTQHKFNWEYKAKDIKRVKPNIFKMTLDGPDGPGLLVTATISFNSDFSDITHFIAEEKIGKTGKPIKVYKLSEH